MRNDALGPPALHAVRAQGEASTTAGTYLLREGAGPSSPAPAWGLGTSPASRPSSPTG